MKSHNQQPQSNGTEQDRDDAWLARPSTIRLLWWVFGVVLALSVGAQLIIKVKGYFGVDGWLGFGAVYGFARLPGDGAGCQGARLGAETPGRLLSGAAG